MASMSVSGIISGMDWESMIDEIITAAAKPAQVQVNKKTNLQNKKSLFEEMKVMVQSIQSSLSPLKLPSTYKAKELDIERIDTSGSYKGVLTASVNADAEVNVYDLKVNRLATAQTNRSNQITTSTIASALGSINSGTMYINMGGRKIGIDVNSTDSLQSLKSRINNTIKTLDNPLNVTASVVDSRLILKSDNTGLGTGTNSETITYNPSSSFTRLNTLTVDTDNELTNFVIRDSKSNKVDETNYVVVNGNEIRWKQYEENQHVGLNESVSVKYTLAAGDTYTIDASVGKEAELPFDIVDGGTLAERLKITDEDGNTYTYGTDFEIVDNKVSWLATDYTKKTYGPNNYTVSYNKPTSTETLSLSKSVNDNDPDDFTVKYTVAETTYTYSTEDSSTNLQAVLDACSDYNQLVVTGSDGTKYIYGTDFDIDTGTSEIAWRDNSNAPASYTVSYTIAEHDLIFDNNSTSLQAVLNACNDYNQLVVTGSDGTKYTYNTDFSINTSTGAIIWTGDTPSSYSVSYTDSSENRSTYYSNAETTTNIQDVIEACNGKHDELVVTDQKDNIQKDNITYILSRDFDIGENDLEWHIPEAEDAITDTDNRTIQEIYNEAYALDEDTELPTFTFTNGDVTETYLDPADRYEFTLTDTNGNKYVYGRDYLIRIDDNDSYISWAQTRDGGTVSSAVTTYATEKGIDTEGMQISPAGGTYSLAFGKSAVTAGPVSTTKSSTETLSELLELDEIDAEYLTIKDTSGNTISSSLYTITDGKITWGTLMTAEPTGYTVSYDDGTSSASTSDGTTSEQDVLNNAQDDEDSYQYITITRADGTQYVYGAYADYTLEKDNDGNVYINWNIDETPSTPDKNDKYTLTYKGFSDVTASIEEYTTEDGDEYNIVRIASDSGNGNLDGLYLSYEQVLEDPRMTNGTSSFADCFTLTDGTTTYTYGTDYTITKGYADSTSKEHALVISWLNEEKDMPDDLTLTYLGGGEVYELGTSVTRSDTDSINPNTANTDRPLYSKFDGATIRITDGKDIYYPGEQGDFTISASGTGDVQINWNDAATTNVSYSVFSDAKSITITIGDDTYTSGEDGDFVIEDDGNGNAKITWNDTAPSDLSDAVVNVTTKDGSKKVYSIADDGVTVQKGASWYTQDNSSAATYTVYVTKNNVTTTYTATRNANSYALTVNSKIDYPSYSEAYGNSTITQGTKTFYEGIDYKIVRDEDDSTRAAVKWLSDKEGGYEWYMPNPGSGYTLNITDDDGTTKSYTGYRNSRTTLNMANIDGNGNGFTTANGHISVKYGDDERVKYIDPEGTTTTETTDDDGNTTTTTETGNESLRYLYAFTVNRGTQGGVDTVFNFNWLTPTRTTNEDLPSSSEEFTVEYEYDANTFSLSDDMDGDLIAALGLDQTDAEHYTAAQDAELELDGEIITRSSNYIGESYDNEIIKGMTIQLKGVGEVSLDVSHNAEKAVESINTFMESYNSLMSWMNTRMTESQVDEDTAATVDSDDFRMRWGLLHGNALLRQTKSQMRDLMAQTFNYSFTQRTSSSEIYGTMSFNGLKADSTLRLRIGTKYADVTIYQTDTLQDIVDRINDSSNTEMRSMFYDDEGKLLGQPLLKASINDDKLVISSTSDDAITMSGTAAMNVLKMNYTYKGLFQLGLSTTSTDYGKSGELEFDESAFMEAMTDNPDEVQELMLMFAGEMDTWVKGMLTTSASGETSGTLTRQIEDLETQIESINDYLEKYQDRLDRQEEALRTRYANAETQFYKLSQQANSISAILNQLNGYTSSSSSDS